MQVFISNVMVEILALIRSYDKMSSPPTTVTGVAPWATMTAAQDKLQHPVTATAWAQNKSDSAAQDKIQPPSYMITEPSSHEKAGRCTDAPSIVSN
jgi:hypothetical protein